MQRINILLSFHAGWRSRHYAHMPLQLILTMHIHFFFEILYSRNTQYKNRSHSGINDAY